jgi:H2-forming N5,N10-methylenetetrahydromethanopterin dehydrogenase-like enzyme
MAALQKILKGIIDRDEEEKTVTNTRAQERIDFMRGLEEQMRIRKKCLNVHLNKPANL